MSAPFIPQFFKAQLDQVLAHTDIVFGNESEAEAYADAAGYPEPKNIHDTARRIALLPKTNASRPRVVIFTQGADSTILVSADEPDKPQVFPVEKVADGQIVDTNGAGDAFAGGVLAALVAGRDLSKAVLAGHALARASIGQVCIFTSTSYHFLMQSGYRLAHSILGPRSTSSRDRIFFTCCIFAFVHSTPVVVRYKRGLGKV
jgi:adenosine kinase